MLIRLMSWVDPPAKHPTGGRVRCRGVGPNHAAMLLLAGLDVEIGPMGLLYVQRLLWQESSPIPKRLTQGIRPALGPPGDS